MSRKKPPHLRLLEGNPGKRKIKNAGVQPKGDAQRPDYLIGYAAEVWERIVTAMPAGTYRATDAWLLAGYCTAVDEHRTATLRLVIEGRFVLTPRGKLVRNPWSVIQRDAAREINTIGPRLGLDPIAREHLPSPTPPPRPGHFNGLIGATIPTDGENDDH